MCRHIAGTGDDSPLALESLPLRMQHVFQKVDRSVACCFGSHEAAAKFQTFASEHAGKFRGDTLVRASHIADLAAANPDVSSWNVGIMSNMAIELGHETLAKSHDFTVRTALWVEIGTTFAATHG